MTARKEALNEVLNAVVGKPHSPLTAQAIRSQDLLEHASGVVQKMTYQILYFFRIRSGDLHCGEPAQVFKNNG